MTTQSPVVTPLASSKEVIATPWVAVPVDWLIAYLRWPWLAMTLALVWLNPEADPETFFYVYLIIGLAAFHNVLQSAALYLRFYQFWMRLVGVVVDLGVAGLIILIAGSQANPLLPVAIFPVLYAALGLGVVGGLSAAVPMALVYVGSAAIRQHLTSLADIYTLISHVALLGVAAGVAGLLRSGSETGIRRGNIPLIGAPSKELEQLQRAYRHATVVRQMATTLSATLSYDRVLRTMLELSMIAISESDEINPSLVGLVMLFEQEGNFEQLRVYAGRNIPRMDESQLVSGKSDLIAQVVYDAEPRITGDVSNDPVFSQLLCMREIKSVLCVPLRAGLDTFGVVVLGSSISDFFNAEHAELLSTFCHQASLALKNAQLYQNLQLEQRRILEKESEARHKLARELHDGPTQSISAIAMRLNYVRMMIEKQQALDKVVEEVAQIEELARKTTQEIRMMLFTLRPVILETRGLVAALRQYAERLRQTDGLNVRVDAQGYRGQLEKEAEGVIFSIVEEAISNVKKHAKARNVLIRLRVEDHLLRVEIQDDGVGFDAKAARLQREAGHMGLLNMEDRAEYLGGHFSVESQPGAGTCVRLEIPLHRWSAVG
ncbi:MAG: GAF domain-containing sensor histidine kinase [Anaerolineae bacterium]|nr:GAF domain-containing sensor histidine kinase [Anaerolineae bacterium]MDW8070088.1 GAF domain-containing sensor histidine kinase [Anaerolineae bacterium]